MPRLDVVDLRAAPEHAGRVAGWLHGEWYRHRGMALEQVLQRPDPDQRFPARFVACLDDATPVGTFTLEPITDPANERPLFCLSNLFVDPDRRGKGIGSRLCEAALEQTRALRIPRLSLMTTTHAAWYASLGWRYVRQVVPLVGGREMPATLMARDLPVIGSSRPRSR